MFGDRKGIPRVSPRASSVAVGLELFKMGDLAMCFDGSWRLQDMVEAKGIRWDIQVLPGRRIDGKLHHAVVANGLGDCIWRHTRKPEKAWRFMKHLSSAEYQRRLPVIPSRKDAQDAWINRLPVPAHRRVVIDQVKHALPLPVTPEPTVWQESVNNEMESVLVSGESSARKAMERAVPKANAKLKEIYERRARRRGPARDPAD